MPPAVFPLLASRQPLVAWCVVVQISPHLLCMFTIAPRVSSVCALTLFVVLVTPKLTQCSVLEKWLHCVCVYVCVFLPFVDV